MDQFPFFWHRPNAFDQFCSDVEYASLIEICRQRRASLFRPYWQSLHDMLALLPSAEAIEENGSPIEVDCRRAAVSVGRAEQLGAAQRAALENITARLRPWRKGPFSLFGRDIDAEWRSDCKWSRIEPHLPLLAGKRICDVGCGNGYYMWRLSGLAEQQRAAGADSGLPECIIGLDPSETFFHVFEIFQRYIRRSELQIEMLGVEHLRLFPRFFDLVLCLGVLYHQRNPIAALESLRHGMKPGGTLILESLMIDGEDSLCLVPADRYAKARNVYFIPTAAALLAWLGRCGFINAEILDMSVTTPAEQRATADAPFQSLVDYLDPHDSSKTVEGYPAPKRIIVRATA